MNQDALGCDGENTKLDATGRRLVLFAPNDYPWCDMEVDLSRVIRKDIEAGQGGSELVNLVDMRTNIMTNHNRLNAYAVENRPLSIS